MEWRAMRKSLAHGQLSMEALPMFWSVILAVFVLLFGSLRAFAVPE
jgi:hypothetical protein